MKIVQITRAKEPPGADHDFHVIGVALSTPSMQAIVAAFPHCILQPVSSDLREQAGNLCDLLGRVVIFNYIPAMQALAWLRMSAIFSSATVKVIGVHPQCTEELYDRALDAEFAGVIEADAGPETYYRSAVSVQRGELWFPRGYLSKRAREAASTASPGNLSSREVDIVDLLASGMTNQRIADKLFISRDTVRWHLRSIYTKLGVSDRGAAFRMAKNKLSAAPREQGRRSMA